MFCLQTIVAINNEMAAGKTLDEAHEACGVNLPSRRKESSPKKAEEKPACGVSKSPVKAVA
jgi:hypothetical protein